jgi:hypothetical protein
VVGYQTINFDLGTHLKFRGNSERLACESNLDYLCKRIAGLGKDKRVQFIAFS